MVVVGDKWTRGSLKIINLAHRFLLFHLALVVLHLNDHLLYTNNYTIEKVCHQSNVSPFFCILFRVLLVLLGHLKTEKCNRSSIIQSISSSMY